MPRLIDLGDVLAVINASMLDLEYTDENRAMQKAISMLPTVDAEPVQSIEFEWCHDCKEYDQNAHCCHRWTKVIRNTVNDLKTQGYEPVRHGHWTEKRNPMMYQSFPYVWVCDQCGTAFYYKTPYCGECGAKMDEVEE